MILSLLFVVMAQAAGVSNLSDCRTDGWDISRLVSQESFQFERVKPAGCVTRLQVSPSDRRINDGHRAELKDPLYLKPGAEVVYSFQLLVPSSTRGATSRLVLAQWHDKKSPGLKAQRPPLSLRLEGDSLIFPYFSQSIWEKNPAGPGKNLAVLPARFGEWMKITVQARWADDASGYLKIFVNDLQVGETQGPVGYAADQFSPYFKMGVYTVHPLQKPAAAYFANYHRSIFKPIESAL